MQTYSLNNDGAATLRRRGTLRIFGTFPVLLASFLVLLWLTKETAEFGVRKTLIAAVVLAAGASIGGWFAWVDQIRKYKLLIDADAICMIGRTSATTILRGQIRQTWERKDGFYLSGRTGKMARLSGYVWISNQLPEYVTLKEMLTSWRES